MRIAVTDANIFIDLIFIDQLHFLFNVELEIFTSSEVLDELNTHQVAILNQYITTGELVIRVLTVAELESLDAMENTGGMSITDKTVFFLAEQLEATLLTGDRFLKKYCIKNEIEVHGLLWLLERFIEHELLHPSVACEKLVALMKFNPRLPLKECNELISKWKHH